MGFIGRYFLQIRKYALVVLISTILGIFAYSYTHHILDDMIKQSLIEIAKQGAVTIEDNINEQLENLTTISLLNDMRGKTATLASKLRIIKSINERSELIEYAIATPNGDLYGAFGERYYVAGEEFFGAAMAGNRIVTISNQTFSRSNSIVFAVPVYTDDFITGVLCAIYPNEYFSRLVEDIAYCENGYGYILDEKGVTIAHKDRYLVEADDNFILNNKNNPEAKKLVELGKRMIAGETGAGSYTYNGEEKYMGFTKINGVKWSLATTAPRADVFRNANPVLIFMMFGICIFGLVLICINVYFVALNKKVRREELTLKNAIETANIIIISFLEDGVILDFNLNAEEWLGYERDQVVKTLRIYDLLGEKDQNKLREVLESGRAGGREDNFELCMRTRNGGFEHVIFNLNILDTDDDTIVFELMGIDISDRVKSENELLAKHEELSAVYEELAASEEELKDQLDELMRQKRMLQEKDERHNLVVEASNIGIWDWDVVTGSHFYSDKWYDIFEMGKEEFRGRESEWMDFILPEDIKVARAAYKDHLERKTPYYECEYRIQTREGRIKWVYAVGKGLWDAEGNLIKMAGSYTDITAKKEIEEKVKRLAYFDTLTGLSNRSQLSEKFSQLIKKTERIAIIYIDLDNFRLINDSYGHDIGDKLLIEVSNRLNDYCNEKMQVSRIGGDKYAILVHDYDCEESLCSFSEELIERLENLIRINDYNISLSINIGIGRYPEDAASFDDLLKNAETAMYRTNEQQCKYLFYNKGMNDAIVERLNLRNSLKAAMENGEFILYYQPQYRSRDRKIMGFEALVRWKSKSLGMIPPSKFIPVAEESKLIIPLGEWILEEAIKFIKKIHSRGYPDLIISVNISVIQLIQRNFSETVLHLIQEYDLPPESLELEITESVMMESVDSVLHNIVILRSAGIRIALDDFGTGYSSLNYLTQLPINTLKIDKSFIDDIGQVKEKGLLLGSIVEIGRKLGLSIVAEGVETEDQLSYLARRNCERVQGYLFSKPIPEEDVLCLPDIV